MSIPYEYVKSENAIKAKCSECLTDSDIKEYFCELMSGNEEICNAHEIVDFTDVKKFESTYIGFSKTKTMYMNLAKKRVIAKTTFIVSSEHQYGMARMYSALLDGADTEVNIEYQDNKVI